MPSATPIETVTTTSGWYVSSTPCTRATVCDRLLKDVLAMIYRHLGIDPETTLLDFSGRPRYLLERGELIRELI